jgi:hypothetical protein
MGWNFDWKGTESTRITHVKTGQLLHIDNWVNGKMLAVALDSGTFNISTGLMEYKVFSEGKIQTIQDWQMRKSLEHS